MYVYDMGNMFSTKTVLHLFWVCR